MFDQPISELLSQWEATPESMPTELEVNQPILKNIIRRLENKIDLIFRFLVEDQLGREQFGEPVRCDISGGGLRFVHEKKYDVGQHLEFEIWFRDFPPFLLQAVAEVVRIEANESPSWGPGAFRVGVKFVEIKEADREKLVCYIFKTQRNNLRKNTASADSQA